MTDFRLRERVFSAVGGGVKLSELFPKLKVLEGLVLHEVAASDMYLTAEVFADEFSVIEYGVKFPVPARRNVKLEGHIFLLLEDVAAPDGINIPDIVVNYVIGIGNDDDHEVNPPTTYVEALLTVCLSLEMCWRCKAMRNNKREHK